MSIFADQADRLTREAWHGADGARRLSEELKEIFLSDSPLQISGPVEITNAADVPAITITHDAIGDPTIPPILVQPPTGVSLPITAPPIAVSVGAPGGAKNPANTGSGDSGSPAGNTRLTGQSKTFNATWTDRFHGTIVGGAGAVYTVAIDDKTRDTPDDDGYTLNAPSSTTVTIQECSDDALWDAGTFIDSIIRVREVKVVRTTWFDSAGNKISISDKVTITSEHFIAQLPVWL